MTGELEPALTTPAAGDQVALRYTPERPLVLFTDFPPDAGGGANVIINGLLTESERRAVVRVSPSPPAAPPGPGGPPVVTLRRGSYGRTGRRSWVADMVRHASALADETAAVARERGAAGVWVVLHNAGVPVGLRLARGSGFPVHVGVNDDPPYGVALRSRRGLMLVPWVARTFAAALRAASSVDTTSAPMRDRYLRRYGVDSVVTHRGVAGPLRPNSAFTRAAGELSVGVLGNVYAYAQLPLLGRAVAAAAAKVGARGKVVVLGQGFGDRLGRDLAPLGVGVDAPGHVSEAAAVDRLRGCLAVYLNYPFGWRDRVMRQTSFTDKLSTYLWATRPVLFHGPTDTTVNGPMAAAPGFFRHWTDADPAAGAGLLADLWADPAADESWTAGAEAVRAGYYDLPTYRRNLIGALNRLG